MSEPQPPEKFVDRSDDGTMVDIHMADGLFVKQLVCLKAGIFMPQHAHEYDHLSMLAVGSVRIWCDGAFLGEFTAPKPILIKAGVKHLFEALEPGTTIYCIHNISRTGEYTIADEHRVPVEA